MVARAGDVNVLQLIRVQPACARELWNDLVGASSDVETVYVVTAKCRAQISADLRVVQAERGDLLMVNRDFRLRLVILETAVCPLNRTSVS